MATRFELVLDDAGKFHFQLRGPDAAILLRSIGCDGRIKAQTGVLHVRSALRDPARSVTRGEADGAYSVVVSEADGSLLARSAKCDSEAAAQQLLADIRKVSDTAPIIDLTKQRARPAAG